MVLYKIKHNNFPNEIIKELGIINKIFITNDDIYTDSQRSILFENVEEIDDFLTEEFMEFIDYIPIYKYDDRFKDWETNDVQFNNDYDEVKGFKFIKKHIPKKEVLDILHHKGDIKKFLLEKKELRDRAKEWL